MLFPKGARVIARTKPISSAYQTRPFGALALNDDLYLSLTKATMNSPGIVLALVGAFIGNTIAGIICVAGDHAQVSRTHHHSPGYAVRLNEYEIAGAVIGALPGGALILMKRRTKPLD
jgi:hypothetical protein